MLRALVMPAAPTVGAASRGERILVVGIGPASMSMLAELKFAGFDNVSVLAKDDQFGGKCVNVGCMPVEFALSLPREMAAQEKRTRLVNFVAALRADVQRNFQAMGYQLHHAQATHVTGKSLVTSEGAQIRFDRLVLGTGGITPLPARLPALAGIVDIERFWELPVGARVVIYADNDPSAVSLGEVARTLGLEPTVLLAGPNPLAALPSYKYFLREIIRSGIAVHEGVRLLAVDATQLSFDSRGKGRRSVGYDYLLIHSRSVPNFLPIDGRMPSLSDIDMPSGSLPLRADIHYIGDALGLMTASEAELHARLLVRSWSQPSGSPDMRDVGRLPVSFHAARSLAMVGEEWTYRQSKWSEVDFRSLGWSRVAELEGKLWYVLDENSAHVRAIHICHRNASELIGVGAALMEYPIDSPRWHQTSTHPSSVEIFKIVSDQARGKIAPPLAASVAVSQPSATNHEFQLVRVDGLNSGRDLPDWLTPADWRAAVLSAEPFRSFAVLFGLAQLSTLLGKPIVPEGTAASISLSAQSTQPSSASAVARNVPAVPGLQISVRADSVLLLCMGVSVIVRY